MQIKYTTVFVNDMEEAAAFFTDKLGFSIGEKTAFDEHTDQLPLRINNSQYLNLTVDKGNAGFKTRVILNTDDCLKDYHNLKIQGVDFKAEPQYQPAGLYAEFADDYGNEYVLLEERNYNDL